MLSSEKIKKISMMLINDHELWDVLTATRGPDDEDDKVKAATTGVIRYKLLGPTAGVRHYSGFIPDERNMHGSLFGPDCEEYVTIRENMYLSHFYHHARKAFTALGLKWGEVNK